MTAFSLLERLRSDGATVAANGDRLKLAAPPGVLVPDVLESLARHKAEILQLLDLERRSQSTPVLTDSSRQAARIRRLAVAVTPAEFLAAYATIKPFLKLQMNKTDLHELALTLAYGSKPYCPP